MTWNGGEFFVANNRQLLVLGKDFGYRRRVDVPLQVNTHQLAYANGRVWALKILNTHDACGVEGPR